MYFKKNISAFDEIDRFNSVAFLVECGSNLIVVIIDTTP
jgi:hypothetical protein